VRVVCSDDDVPLQRRMRAHDRGRSTTGRPPPAALTLRPASSAVARATVPRGSSGSSAVGNTTVATRATAAKEAMDTVAAKEAAEGAAEKKKATEEVVKKNATEEAVAKKKATKEAVLRKKAAEEAAVKKKTIEEAVTKRTQMRRRRRPKVVR
jgi:hypothetical protein